MLVPPEFVSATHQTGACYGSAALFSGVGAVFSASGCEYLCSCFPGTVCA
mgnify:CR=1 FL=1